MVTHSQKFLNEIDNFLDISGNGLEIAPYFDPCLRAPKYNIMYTDYISNEEIQAKAAENPDVVHSPPLIDFTWNPGKPLKDCAPEGLSFDYALASHVMEHVPNPIGWLNNVLSILKIGGRLAIFLPSKKFSFDCYRVETQYHQLVEWWIEQPPIPTTGQLIDFMGNAISVYHDTVFNEEGVVVDGKPHYGDSNAIDAGVFVYQNQNYLDVHCTVWNGSTFPDIFDRIIKNGLMNVSIDLVSEEQSEFLVIFTKLGEPSRLPPPKREG